MSNDFLEKTLQQAKDLGKELGERARESAAVTGHQTTQAVETAKSEAIKAAPQVRDLLGKAYKAASDVIAKIDGE
ncbi:MAG: hypothetical protein M3R30_07030 [Candidatus Eremiobacteraeota bacterium]|nr:hypothetical protein [Candidatus Eremiobacteraeota bacterium]